MSWEHEVVSRIKDKPAGVLVSCFPLNRRVPVKGGVNGVPYMVNGGDLKNVTEPLTVCSG